LTRKTREERKEKRQTIGKRVAKRDEKRFPAHIRHNFKILFWSDLFLTIFDSILYIHNFIQKWSFKKIFFLYDMLL
jgi:hypothetical protein